MAELKPCPFCGDNQQLHYVELSNGLHYIECARCGAAPHRLGACNRETAVKYWNSGNRWIPVEDDLPENRVNVIFTINRGTPRIGCGYRIHSERGGLLLTRWFDKMSGLNFSDYDVKAWMPMPDAYEQTEKEADNE